MLLPAPLCPSQFGFQLIIRRQITLQFLNNERVQDKTNRILHIFENFQLIVQLDMRVIFIGSYLIRIGPKRMKPSENPKNEEQDMTSMRS